jgi:ferredoxin-nitrite reductase
MDDKNGLSEEQKQYLEGFLGGLVAKRGVAPATASGPADIHRLAQDRFIAAGKTLAPEEEAKRKAHPLDMWDEIRANAAADRFPKGIDVFRHKFFGLFYVAPNQNAFMCRLRLPNGILSAHQFRGVADIAQRFGGGYAHVTTRANLQIREIGAQHPLDVLTALYDLGIVPRGAGADNIRNITGSPTAGIDPHELFDTRPLCHELHYHILNHRELYGLPRKFNIGIDGGGAVSVLEDTNDIGFAAVEVPAGAPIAPGVYFRMQLGGITGHGDFARDTGVLLRPEECVSAAVAVVRIFIGYGDRTDRKKARLKYLLDAWGLDAFMAKVEEELGRSFVRFPVEACRPRGPALKLGHVGLHRQKQPGLNYIGVALPVGQVTVEQMRGLADLADRFGSGTVRLTVWQNLLISDIPDERLDDAKDAIEKTGLTWRADNIRSALIACTGNTGCRFSATDTKGQALLLAEYLEARVALDVPVNIHLTGCPNSCAQHYVGDIGLLGVKVGDAMAEGYTIVVGGGAGRERCLAREIYAALPMAEVPATVERMLKGYLAHRRDPMESFHEFANRHATEALKALFGHERSEAAE